MYRNIHQLARGLRGVATALYVTGWILGGLLLMFGLVATSESKAGITVLWVMVSIGVTAVGVGFGALVKGIGLIVHSTTNTAINTSPHLTDAEKIEASQC